MAEHPIELSNRFIDSGMADSPHNWITEELSGLSDDIALVESLSHVIAVRTEDGLVAFNSGGWYDGTPSRLKPAPDAVLSPESDRRFRPSIGA